MTNFYQPGAFSLLVKEALRGLPVNPMTASRRKPSELLTDCLKECLL
jgi:hypothetical protein